MKASSGLFAVVLVLWSSASIYWYVCKIKKDCDKQQTELVKKTTSSELAITSVKDKITKDTVSVINELNEKLKTGYILTDFLKNSAVNSHIDTDFTDFAENLKIYLKKNTSDNILIIGYTDNTGTPEWNIIVGKKRAEFLKTKLIEQGINKNRIKTSSKGQENPIADNKTKKGRRLNRRAEITIINN